MYCKIEDDTEPFAVPCFGGQDKNVYMASFDCYSKDPLHNRLFIRCKDGCGIQHHHDSILNDQQVGVEVKLESRGIIEVIFVIFSPLIMIFV